jgi:hypothetical protein
MSKKIRMSLICITLITSSIITFQTDQVKASGNIPVADFTYTSSDSQNSTVINFFDLSTDSDGSVVSWWWSFGDHYYSDTKNPIHCYYVNGLYTVNLSILDNDGNRCIIKKKILIGNPPNVPSNPDPYDGNPFINVNHNLTWAGGDMDSDLVTYDIYFGNTNPPIKVISNQSGTTYNPGILHNDTTYYWMIIAWDIQGASTTGPIWTFSTTENNPPYTPSKPSGQTKCSINKTYYYSTSTIDPDKEQVYYMWFWGDGSQSEWLGPYDSNVEVNSSHIWTKKGIYRVKVKAKDIQGAESYWSNDRLVYVIIKLLNTKNKLFSFFLFLNLVI